MISNHNRPAGASNIHGIRFLVWALWYLSRRCERLRIECGSGVTACHNADSNKVLEKNKKSDIIKL